jgi:hypothetical protein
MNAPIFWLYHVHLISQRSTLLNPSQALNQKVILNRGVAIIQDLVTWARKFKNQHFD